MDQAHQIVFHAACLCIIKQLQKLVFQPATPISIQITRWLLAKTVIQLAQLVVQTLQTA